MASPRITGRSLGSGDPRASSAAAASTTPVRVPGTGRASAVRVSAVRIWLASAYGACARMSPMIPATSGDETDVMHPTPDEPPRTLIGAHSGAEKPTHEP